MKAVLMIFQKTKLLISFVISSLFNISIITIAFSLLALWISFALYVTGWLEDYNFIQNIINDFTKNIENENNHIITRFGLLGTVGDFFNIVTSIASVFTVLLVSYGVYLQRIEIRGLRDGIETGEKINRTLKILDMWHLALEEEERKDGVYRFLKNISLLHNNFYEQRIDFNLIGNIIKDNNEVKEILEEEKSIHQESFNNKRDLKDKKLTLKHFEERNHDILTSKSSIKYETKEYFKHAELEKSVEETKSIIKQLDEKLELIDKIRKMIS